MKPYKNPYIKTIPLAPSQQYRAPFVINTQSGVSVKISNPWINVEQKENSLVLVCNKNKRRILDSCIRTWQTITKFNAKNLLHEVRVEAKSNHFPIFLIPETGAIRVRNYLGLKTDYLIATHPTTTVKRQSDTTIIAQDRDPGVIGALCSDFLNFYKRTHHKKLDRRTFTDRFQLIREEYPL